MALIFFDYADGREKYKYGDVIEKIIGCAMKVHRYFGLDFPEVVYQRALIIELEKMFEVQSLGGQTFNTRSILLEKEDWN